MPAMRIELLNLQWKAWVGFITPISADLSRLSELTHAFSDAKLAVVATR